MTVTLLSITLRSGSGLPFTIQLTLLWLPVYVLTFVPASPEEKLPPWADFHLRLGK
jgi:hypothetical protein